MFVMFIAGCQTLFRLINVLGLDPIYVIRLELEYFFVYRPSQVYTRVLFIIGQLQSDRCDSARVLKIQLCVIVTVRFSFLQAFVERENESGETQSSFYFPGQTHGRSFRTWLISYFVHFYKGT